MTTDPQPIPVDVSQMLGFARRELAESVNNGGPSLRDHYLRISLDWVIQALSAIAVGSET